MALKPMGTTPTRPQTSHPHPKPACLATPHWLRTVHRRTTISRRPWFRHSSPGSKCFAATTVRTIDHRRVHVVVLSATAAPAPAASPGSSIPGTAIQPRPMAETPPRKKKCQPQALRDLTTFSHELRRPHHQLCACTWRARTAQPRLHSPFYAIAQQSQQSQLAGSAGRKALHNLTSVSARRQGQVPRLGGT